MKGESRFESNLLQGGRLGGGGGGEEGDLFLCLFQWCGIDVAQCVVI